MPTTSREPTEIAAINTQPLNKFDESLREQFAKDFADQAARLDELAKQLITLAIAIPGIYAAMLKLVSGDQAKTDDLPLTVLAFVMWFIGLGLTLISLIPLRRQIDLDSMTDIQNYFSLSARRKRRLLIAASLATFFGIFVAALVIFV